MQQRTTLLWAGIATHVTFIIAITVILFSLRRNEPSDWDRPTLTAGLLLAAGAVAVLLTIARRAKMGRRIQLAGAALIAGLVCFVVSVFTVDASPPWGGAGLVFLIVGTIGLLSGLRKYRTQVNS